MEGSKKIRDAVHRGMERVPFGITDPGVKALLETNLRDGKRYAVDLVVETKLSAELVEFVVKDALERAAYEFTHDKRAEMHTTLDKILRDEDYIRGLIVDELQAMIKRFWTDMFDHIPRIGKNKKLTNPACPPPITRHA